MPITTFSSRDFNQHASAAKKASNKGPVFITDRGQPGHVLLSISDYLRLTNLQSSIVDMLAMPGIEDIQFEAPRAGQLYKPADFS